jgi:hypothetical protein
MLFGHNTNVQVEGITYHVQTEDRGVNHAVIDTTVHCRGRVMHRRTKDYLDLLPLDTTREQELRVRLDEQHRAVIAEMHSGALQLPAPPPEPPPRYDTAAEAAPIVSAIPAKPAPTHLKLELLNATTWLYGETAALQIIVRDGSSHAVAGASVSVRVDGASGPVEFLSSSRDDGTANVKFEMPRLIGKDAALVIEARSGSAQGQLRFVLRPKPKGSSG